MSVKCRSVTSTLLRSCLNVRQLSRLEENVVMLFHCLVAFDFIVIICSLFDVHLMYTEEIIVSRVGSCAVV